MDVANGTQWGSSWPVERVCGRGGTLGISSDFNSKKAHENLRDFFAVGAQSTA